MYGATCFRHHLMHEPLGLSPCVRGYRTRPIGASSQRGSIPVCTGLPLPSSCRCSSRRVYPRVYGATISDASMTCMRLGLSPCVRGYRVHVCENRVGQGSIPVCTGLPLNGGGDDHASRVYPRVYGATRRISIVAKRSLGLSPCVRGYPLTAEVTTMPQGSIPVCTGLPSASITP